MDHQPDEEHGGEDRKVRPFKMGTKATVSRLRSATEKISSSRKLRHGSLVIYSKKQGGGLSSEDLALRLRDFCIVISLQMSTY